MFTKISDLKSSCLSGTGTPVGDKVEAAAIHQSFSCNQGKVTPLYVGSVKTNIGHTEAASGLAGLIKSVLMIQYGMIPPNLNFSEPNPEIPLDVWGMKVCHFVLVIVTYAEDFKGSDKFNTMAREQCSASICKQLCLRWN